MDARVVEDALRAQVTVVPVKGGERYLVERGEQTAKFDVLGDEIVWHKIDSPGGGWLREAVDFVKTVAPQHGIATVLAPPGSEDSKATLLRYGFEDQAGPYVVMHVG